MNARSFLFLAMAVLLSACQGTFGPSEPPPVSQPGESGAAESGIALLAEPQTIDRQGSVTLRVDNQSDVMAEYGRPITVERWNGDAWQETEASRQSMWTMDLLMVQAGETGVEQTWPFGARRTPQPGWYRLSKQVQTRPESNAGAVRISARVRVTE